MTSIDKEKYDQILKLDLKNIAKKVKEKTKWSKNKIKKIEMEYRKFLFLIYKTMNKDIGIVPSKEIDEFWHMHILDTRKYAEDCKHIFGKFIHHEPAYEKANKKHLKQLFEMTRDIYETFFGIGSFSNKSSALCMYQDFSKGKLKSNALCFCSS